MVKVPSLRELLESGVHFGHKTSRWHPKMDEFIFTSKAGVHVINLEKTAEKLKEALDFIAKEAAAGKIFIFVGTKKQSADTIKEAAINCNMPYVNVRWLGGTITNFDSIRNSAKRLIKNRESLENSEKLGISKSEIAKLNREVERSEKFLGGLVSLEKQPDALILFGSFDEKNALAEAKNKNIPVVALTDTNADPSLVEYPIPANDDATKSVKFFADLFAKTINENKAKKEEKSQ